MATRVTLPPLALVATDGSTSNSTTSDSTIRNGDAINGDAINGGKASTVAVAKVQLLNDRGDRQAEADWLRSAARPGVVPLLSTSDTPFTIVTAHAGTRTMRTGRLDPAAGLELMLRTCELLADLHRDGFVHGKLTVDHVIIGRDGPVLCSPDGTITDTNEDLAGMARCMRELARQWDEAGAPCSWRTAWDALADRLEHGTDPSASAMRSVQALRRMGRPAPTPIEARSEPFRPQRGLVVAAAVAALFAVGLAVVPNTASDEPSGPRVRIDGAVFAIGEEGDDAVALETPCDPTAPVITLRPSSGEVWAFTSVGDGERSIPIAVVPGATELRAERHGSCDVAVARGPAGATTIDTQALAAGVPSP